MSAKYKCAQHSIRNINIYIIERVDIRTIDTYYQKYLVRNNGYVFFPK